jgi:hypothetical protein
VEPFIPSENAKSFIDFLVDRLGLSEEDEPLAGRWSGTGNTIGSLSLRLGLLTFGQVGRIVDMQVTDRRLFGETAVAFDYMTRGQVDRVLQLQRIHRCLDVGGILVMQGRLELPALLNLIAEYLQVKEDPEAEAIASATHCRVAE